MSGFVWTPFPPDIRKRRSGSLSRILSGRTLQKQRPCRDGHSSGTAVASRLMRPTWSRASNPIAPVWPCSGWGLACHDGFPSRGALLPHLFTLTLRSRTQSGEAGRCVFCATFRRLAAPGRYPASCSVEFGLSSPDWIAPARQSANRLDRASETVGGDHPACSSAFCAVVPLSDRSDRRATRPSPRSPRPRGWSPRPRRPSPHQPERTGFARSSRIGRSPRCGERGFRPAASPPGDTRRTCDA